ncbi:MAG: glycerol-3-phosphate 1-O-acyltransferase [Nitrospirae bacterium]|nr:MAG: glycerol-3-phosphate 1-O-acyltransferase [Nitrospirota bacterium]
MKTLDYLIIVGAYLLGAVPFGLLIAKTKGVDLRRVGSGNIGTTNVLRAVGKKEAIITLVADILKGTVPVLVARGLTQNDTVAALAGAAAVIGHDFPVYLGFRGGKGVATSIGVMLGLNPLLGLLLILVWLITAFLFRYSSLSALTAFGVLFGLSFLPSLARAEKALIIFLSALIYIKHRANIQRLLQGVEPKLGQKA